MERETSLGGPGLISAVNGKPTTLGGHGLNRVLSKLADWPGPPRTVFLSIDTMDLTRPKQASLPFD